MKSQSLFSRKNKKNTISVSSANFAKRVLLDTHGRFLPVWDGGGNGEASKFFS